MWKRGRRHELTRKAFYELIWAEPTYKVAERYKISGVALAKIAEIVNGFEAKVVRELV